MMKKILGLCCGIVAASTMVSAQTPSKQPQTPQTPTTSSTTTTTRQASQPVTIVGCVTPDLASNPNATSTTTHRFVLSNIQPSAGTSDQSRGSATSYLLVPSADANLSSHLNHKVEVTGTMDSSSSSSSTTTSSSSPSNPSASSTSSTQSSSATMPSFRVTSVKMLSETCP